MFLLVLIVVSIPRFLLPSKKRFTEEIPNNPVNEVCLKVSKSTDQYYCLAVANQNPAFCQNLDGSAEKNVCLAMSTKDISYCRKIEDLQAKKFCYYELTIDIDRIDYCDELENQEDCYFALIHRWHWRGQAEKIKVAYCNKLNDGTRQGSLFETICFAYKEEDPSLCRGNKYCLTYFPQPESFCENAAFEAPDGKTFDENDCWGHQAMAKKDSSLCDKVTDEEVRNICYSSHSNHISPNLSLCEKMTDEMRRNMCYVEYAINLSKE